ncbi:outer membrane family protein [Helicobacter anatolicus]|uniref:outer membrane family protein n=1 Tax=Helicobacter anatolicus TaxID=2905874 RepID=UPI001E37F169|nr:outer membrane family protein [Helicobacter anatolicus]
MYKIFLLFFFIAISLAKPLQYDGSINLFSKIGFFNKTYNPMQNLYPTDSYGTLLAQGNITYSPFSFLQFKLGISANGIILDSTKFQNKNTPMAPNITSYIGFYQGHSGVNTDTFPRFFILHNAFLSFQNKNLMIKLGRYELEDYDFFSDYNQGIELRYSLQDFLFYGLFSDARASVYSDWFYDFGRFYTQNHELFILGANYQSHFGLLLKTLIYLSPNYYTAPQINLCYTYQNKNFSSKTTIISLFAFHHHLSAQQNDSIAFGSLLDSQAQTFMFEQDFTYKNFNFGGSIYKNFGNANGRIGIYGNPVSVDIWDGSLYDTGALSDIVGRDALSGIIYLGYNHNYFNLKIQGRHTTSPRSTENAITLYLESQITPKLKWNLKLQYLDDITHKGYTLGAVDAHNNPIILHEDIHSDRSKFILQIIYKI